MITQQQLASLTNDTIANIFFPILEKEMLAGGIDTKNEQAGFLAEIISEGLMKPSENLNYTAEQLVKQWPSLYKTIEFANEYAHNPQKIANYSYGYKGNPQGNDQPGDGWKYRGRGPIGITGKWLYGVCGKAIGIDLIVHPELLEEPLYGLKSAIWFWNWKKLGPEADAGHIDRVSRGVNLGNVNSAHKAINEYSRHQLNDKILKLIA